MDHPLIGREQECDALLELLRRDDVRLISVTGPGGIGKTRLALEVADRARSVLACGVVVVLLAAVSDPEFVITTVAKALGLEGQGAMPPMERVITYLCDRRLILVLDNFEQLMQAAPVVHELLEKSPGLKLVVTSRMRLHLSAEREFALGALRLPALRGAIPARDQARRSPAVALFVQRAQAVRPDFALGDDNIEAVAAICLRLDGWPLAIELAAARVKLLGPEQLLLRMRNRLPLLTGGPVDRPMRQRTMRDTLDWSHELLEQSQQKLFAELSVFKGGATLEAIETVCADAPALLEGLQALVDHGLVLQVDGRFSMLETMREYAAEKLLGTGIADEVRRRSEEYFVALAEAAERHLRGARQRERYDRLASELDNFREVLSWSLESDRAASALRLASALAVFWADRGHALEGRRWLEAALAASPKAVGRELVKALGALGTLAWHLGDVAATKAHLEASLAISGPADEAIRAPWSLKLLGIVHLFTGDREAARTIFEACLAQARASGDRAFEANTLYSLGTLESELENYEVALPLLQRALAMSRSLGDDRLSMRVVGNLGHLASQCGRQDEAVSLFEEAAACARAMGARAELAWQLCNVGDCARMAKDWRRSCACFQESMASALEFGEARTVISAMHNLALLLGEAGPQAFLSAKLLSAADRHRRSFGIVLNSSVSQEFEQCMAALKVRLEPLVLERAIAEGRTLSLVEAVALAQKVDVAAAPSVALDAASAVPAPLTTREIDVLRLVAKSLSDKEIAQRLGIAPATASKHVANLLGKTMSRNRLALALWAAAHGIVAEAARPD